jgi:tRNA-splicing ligase RtcB
MYKEQLKKIGEGEYELPKSGKMLVPIRIFFSEKLLERLEEDALIQLVNVATLPGVYKYVEGMPDMHIGYGFPVGGVAAFDLKKGIIAPGAVGYDINCGVRVLATDISEKEFLAQREKVLHDIKRTIPSGVGRGGKRYSREEIQEVLLKVSEWALEKGFATKDDLERTEENGKMSGANPKDVSQRALSRGLSQLGTLGAGNHFIDIQVVEEIFNEKIAEVFGLKKGNICFMIHCGSRGLGHQVASDYLKLFEDKKGTKGLPDRELVNAPFSSELGQKYFSAMKCAVNFAFCNRQMIMHEIRSLLKRYFPKAKTNLVYDIAHNIAKIEEYDGKELLIVRKGATRSLGKGRKEIPKIYQKTGQPVLIPGSMSTPSYILVGTKEAEEKSFGSSAHGAGRAHSRSWAHKELNINQLKKILAEKNIILEGSAKATIEESELSYKDVEEVINVTHNTSLAKKVVKLKPLAVMIG